jgi:hypothetical protein
MPYTAGMDGLKTPGEMYKDREARKAVMQTSNWIAAQMGPKPDYLPVASTPLDSSYQKSKSETRAAYLDAIETQTRMAREARSYNSPAADFIAKKYAHVGVAPDQEGTTIALGYDPRSLEVSSTKIGASLNLPVEPLDLLERVPTLRDATLDGSHRASQCENHFLPIWSPYDSIHPSRSASFQSANQLREAHHKHSRSQYHPEEKYVLPPTVMSDIGWGLDLKANKAACRKIQHPDMWHGREASAITQFSQRLQLDPSDDRVADELIDVLTALDRGHELLAVLLARLEDASDERRPLLRERTRAALMNLADRVDAAGRADEAGLFRMTADNLP